ncbi:acetate kinase [Clostridium sp. CAG:921]|nr:acetate kinase [Clostridium sp. CAG:921]
MKVLVINCGSSTIKFQLIDMESDTLIAKGRCDMIGYDESNILYKNQLTGKNVAYDVLMPTHKEGMAVLMDTLKNEEYGVIKSLDEIYAVGHRVVHGGEKFDSAKLVDEDVLKEIENLAPLAPLHNPACLMGIKAIMDVAPNLKNVVVFDTAFHQTMPNFNYLYAIDYKYYEKYKIRRYGFHGTSYNYILGRLEELLGKPRSEINAIVCHLGGGASVCAIKNGKSYDTSMGFTPLEGLVMETRCGDLDPAIVTKLMREENLSVDEMDNILNKKSGRLGLSGIGDFRMLKEAGLSGDKQALLTRMVQNQRTKKYIGAYIAELNRVDAIVFTGGVMENNADEIEMTISDMDCLGIELDKEANEKGIRKESLVSKPTSKIKLYIIPTNEELQIAKETVEVVSNVK